MGGEQGVDWSGVSTATENDNKSNLIYSCEMSATKYKVALRLELLEPGKHPYLFKCLYGLLMLLPQSSAFETLRNRLNCVSTMGVLHLIPKEYVIRPILFLV